MTYQRLLEAFSKSTYSKFIIYSLNHVVNKNDKIQLSEDLFKLCIKFRENNEFELYIKLNDFFNDEKSIQNETRALLLISASNSILTRSYFSSIDDTFFIIHSVVTHDVKYKEYGFSYELESHPYSVFLPIIVKNHIPKQMSNYIFEHLTYTIAYARKLSTEYELVKFILEDIMTPQLTNSINTYAYDSIDCINFLIQLFEWCNDNNKESEHVDSFNNLYYLLDDIQEFTPSLKYDMQLELCLFRFREGFKKDYDYNELLEFYDSNINDIPILHKLRILTQLFLKLDKEKYLNIYSEEISDINTRDLRLLIEQISPNIFSAYLINLGFYKKNHFIDFIEKTYHCSKDILEATSFYFHSDDYTYILGKEQRQLDMIPEQHSTIISYINEINNLNITVKHESKYQKEEYHGDRENVPIDHFKDEKKIIANLKEYYQIDNTPLDESIKYILLFQQIRVPLQQLLLKKYDRLFPFINIFNKKCIPVKPIDKIIHIVLSESSTLDQEKNTIKYLDTLSENVIFEYKYIDNFNELMSILNSNEYSIISITSHGKINTRNPLENQIKVGDEYIDMLRFKIDYNNLESKRLLYLNICDSGHYSLKNGFMVESLSAQLTDNTQALISNMWPINPTYSSTFLMLFFHHMIKINDYKEAYKSTLSLAINNELDKYICDNNLYIEELELFRIFNDSSINKQSIVHWGAMIYQE